MIRIPSYNILFRKILTLIAMLCIVEIGFSQEKVEKEFRVERGEVPETALDFIDGVEFNKRMKWYREEGNNSFSYELKTRINGKKYSIEFDSIGRIEDIEVQHKKRELLPGILEIINQNLNDEFDSFSIEKIQVQYTGPTKNLKRFLMDNSSDKLEINYEIVVRSKDKLSHELYEYLFSSEGEIRSRVKIRLRNTDNLEN